MLSKFDLFKKELTNLCLKHEVCLSTSGYDSMQVWNLEGDEPLHCAGFEDYTAEYYRLSDVQ